MPAFVRSSALLLALFACACSRQPRGPTSRIDLSSNDVGTTFIGDAPSSDEDGGGPPPEPPPPLPGDPDHKNAIISGDPDLIAITSTHVRRPDLYEAKLSQK